MWDRCKIDCDAEAPCFRRRGAENRREEAKEWILLRLEIVMPCVLCELARFLNWVVLRLELQ